MGKAATQKPISERAQEASGNLPVPQASAAPPADLMEFAAEQGGRGVSTAADDNLVPLIYVLHYSSPQVDRRDNAYIEGAEPGDIWLRGAPLGMEIIKPHDGLLVQPCYFYKDVGEWRPRQEGGGGGQGFICRHPEEAAKDVAGAVEDPDDKNHWTITRNGEVHDLVETRNHAVLVYHPSGRVMPYLIPLSSTGHGVSRAWMSQINGQIIQQGSKKGEPWDSFARLYVLRTEPRANKLGKWFSFTTEEGPWCDREKYLMGRKLHEQFARGEKRAEAPEASADPAPAAGGTNTDALA